MSGRVILYKVESVRSRSKGKGLWVSLTTDRNEKFDKHFGYYP